MNIFTDSIVRSVSSLNGDNPVQDGMSLIIILVSLVFLALLLTPVVGFLIKFPSAVCEKHKEILFGQEISILMEYKDSALLSYCKTVGIKLQKNPRKIQVCEAIAYRNIYRSAIA